MPHLRIDNLAARLVARYSQGREADSVSLEIKRPDGSGEVVTVIPLPVEELSSSWHV